MARKGSGKRANKEGSVYQIADGTWRGAVSIGDGRRKYVRGATQADVVRQLTEIKARLATGESIEAGSRQRLGEFVGEWLESARQSVRPRTFDAYESHIRMHVRPALGHIALADLTTRHVQRWIDQMHRDGASARSIRRYHGVLHTALDRARRRGLVRANVASTDLLDLPRVEDYEWNPLSLDEAQRLLAVVRLVAGGGDHEGPVNATGPSWVGGSGERIGQAGGSGVGSSPIWPRQSFS